MKKLIWGAGEYGKRFAYSLGKDNFDCFIDKDRNKAGKILFGKRILSPDDINGEDWKCCFFYVPFNYKDDVASFLIAKGVDERHQQVYGNKVCFPERTATEELRTYEERLPGAKKDGIRNLVFGHTLGRYRYDRLMCGFPAGTAVISENMCGEEDDALYRHPVLHAPAFADPYSVVRAEESADSSAEDSDEKKYLQEAAEQLGVLFEGTCRADCLLTARLLYKYYLKTLQALDVSDIICLGSTTPQHRILMEICREHGIRIIFTHPGVLPGTLAFEEGGEVGESPVTLHADRFKSLPITSEEDRQAADVWRYLRESGLNRKIQPKNGLSEDSERRIDKSKPIVLFMGQNDVESYMVPYTDETKKYWSPIFESSTDAAVYLANLCEKNGWNFIYKPHPMYSRPEQVERLPANTIFIEFGNINDIIDRCDVAVTILSSANYVALIRKKPVVMLGYNQIKGTGCCYEAYEENRIEAAIKEALTKGFTEEQQRNFQTHIAQLVKYYLYDDMQPRELRYGKAAPKSFEDFYELNRLLLNDMKQE